MIKVPYDIREKFISRISINHNTGCLEYSGPRNDAGYGIVMIDGRRVRAHRLSWHLFVGDLPDDMCVLHKCDNPICVNTEHLFLGTQLDNIRDMVDKGRNKSIYSDVHRQLADHNLTREDIITIRSLRGRCSPDEVAIKYGKSKRSIIGIMNGERYADVR